MALKNKTQSNTKLSILKVFTKDENGSVTSPFFQILVKDKESGKWEKTGTATTVTGKIYKVEHKKQEFKGQEVLNANVYLKDGDDAYLLELRYNMLGRSLINSIVNIQDFDKEVEISLFNNKKGYASASITSDGEKVSWKYSLEEQPKPQKVKFKGKDMSDFTEVDAFFSKEIIEMAALLNGDVVNEDKSDKSLEVEDSDKDDVPF